MDLGSYRSIWQQDGEIKDDYVTISHNQTKMLATLANLG